MSTSSIRPAFLTRMCAVFTVSAAVIAFGASQATAADFYKGKQVSLIIGYGPGGGYDTYARFVARFIGDRIPGKPAIVARNMPGAGSLKAANHLYNVAPKDGTVIGAVSQNLSLMQVIGQKGIKFDASKFSWIGRITDADAIVVAWHGSKAKTLEDAKKHEIPVAIGSGLSGSVLYVSFMNKLAGTKFDGIAGYSSGMALLAMERGEVDATSRALWSALKAKKPDWIKDGKVNVMVQVTLDKQPDLPDVPRMVDLVTDPEDRKIMTALTAPNAVGRSLSAPPDMPATRLATLRTAFDATLTDPDVLAEAEKARLDINHMPGQKLGELVAESSQLSEATIAKIQEIAKMKYRKVEKSKE